MPIALIAGLTMLISVGLMVRDLRQVHRGLAFAFLGWVMCLSLIARTSFFETHFSAFPPFPIRFAILLLTLLLLALLNPSIRQAWMSIPLERLVLWHWMRVPIGLCFVVAASSGVLAQPFGSRAGRGDVVAGLLAIAIAVTPVLRRRLPLFVWTLWGALDLVVAIGTAMLTVNSPIQRYPFADQMRLLAHLPFALIPTCFVPLFFFTHGLIAVRLAKKA